MHAGTTPDSGTPKKNRAARRPEAFLTAAIQLTIVPKRHIMIGKYILPESFFITRFDGIKRTVTEK